MQETVKVNIILLMVNIYKIVRGLFFIISAFYIASWIILQTILTHKHTSEILAIYSDTYGVIALWAGIIGFISMGKFGYLKSAIGQFIFLFSLGVLFQFIGQVINSYYRVILEIEAPYPSFADLFYFLSIPIYIYGSMMILKVLGAKKFFNKPFWFLLGLTVVLSMISIDYFLFLKDYDASSYTNVQVFLDYSYPLLQALYVALTLLAYLVSTNKLGGMFKNPIMLLLLALTIQYLADTTFTYELLAETLYAGDLPDLLYVLAYVIMGISFIEFTETYLELKSPKLWEKTVTKI